MTDSGTAQRTAERLTDRELAVWRSLQDTTTELRRRLSAELQQVELSPGDYAVLLALTEASDRTLRSSELADAIDWERSRAPTAPVTTAAPSSSSPRTASRPSAGPPDHTCVP